MTYSERIKRWMADKFNHGKDSPSAEDEYEALYWMYQDMVDNDYWVLSKHIFNIVVTHMMDNYGVPRDDRSDAREYMLKERALEWYDATGRVLPELPALIIDRQTACLAGR